VTQEGRIGDCERGASGSFGDPGSSRLSDAVGACLQRCSQCPRCRYISVSTRHNDCSWFSACQLSRLRPTSITRTFLSGPASPPWNASVGKRPTAPRRMLNATCPVAELNRSISWDPTSEPPSASQPRRRTLAARIALLQAADFQLSKPSRLKQASASDEATWRVRTPPCWGAQLNFFAAAINREFARRHGYDYVQAHGDCWKQLGRHPAWCKTVMLKGLLWDVAGTYEWVVSLDSDAVFNDPRTSVEAWLALGAGGRARDLPLSQLATDRCAASHHGGQRLRSACMVVGKDLSGAPGINSGVVFVRRSQEALRLLASWWSWPGRGADGELDTRQRWLQDFAYEQVALNGFASDAGVLVEAGSAAECLRVVPTRELFLPGHRVMHFTGPCLLAPRYQPADGSYLHFGSTRKCRCLLSHFGASVVARLAGADDFNTTACRTKRLEVVPPQWPHPPNASIAALTVTYTWHGC